MNMPQERRPAAINGLWPGGLFYGWLTAGLLALCLTACQSRPTLTQDQAAQDNLTRLLPVAGPWSDPAAGLRCRARLSAAQAPETAGLRAAIAIQNVSSHPITITSSGPVPFARGAAHWHAGPRPMILAVADATTAEPTSAAVRLEPGASYITPPMDLLIPPGPGQQPIHASLVMADAVLATPPIPVNVAPVAWGPVTDGLRLRLSSARPTYATAEAPQLFLFIHNASSVPITLHPPALSEVQTRARGPAVGLALTIAEDQYVELAPGMFWSQPIPGIPLLAPGKYHFKLGIDAPELSIEHRTAWHGKLISNDEPIEVSPAPASAP